MSKAVVVLSGGQDSTICLYQAKARGDEVHAITFNYGQRHARELEAATHIARMAGCASHEEIALGAGVLQGRSPLVSGEALETYNNFAEMDKIIGNRVEKTFVPMRNALFLTIAANRAVCLDADYVVTGVCQADNANYPDCRRVFIDAMQEMCQQALGRAVNIRTPLMNKSKAESIHMAVKLDGCYHALAYSHTAYDGAYPPVGRDHASVLRAHGFEEANIPDPLVLRAWMEGAMALPDTINYANPVRDEWLAHLRAEGADFA